MNEKAIIHIPIDHPAVFWGSGEFTYQGDCPVRPGHQTCITLGQSVCPGCDAVFLVTKEEHLGKVTGLMAKF